jgi:heme A synthase
MPTLAPALVYGLCLLASLACAGLLLRAWRQSRSRLLFWTAAAFVFLAINNLVLVGDMVIFPAVDLSPYRIAAHLGAVAVLLYAFVWEGQA